MTLTTHFIRVMTSSAVLCVATVAIRPKLAAHELIG